MKSRAKTMESSLPATLDIVYHDSGGGHRTAALALRDIIQRQNRPWETRLVSLQELLNPIDILRKLTGVPMQEIYNILLKNGWTLGSPQLKDLMQAIIRSRFAETVRLLEAWWERSRP